MISTPGQKIAGGATTRAEAPLDRIPVFVRAGAIVPSQQAMQYTHQYAIDPLTLTVYPLTSDGTVATQYYEDDGTTFDYLKGVVLRRTHTQQRAGNSLAVEISPAEGSFRPAPRIAHQVCGHSQGAARGDGERHSSLKERQPDGDSPVQYLDTTTQQHERLVPDHKTVGQVNDSSYGMNEADKKHAQALVNRLLHEAGDKGAAGEYKHALTAVRKAKALDLTNVYTLALERQLEQIEELAVTGLVDGRAES